MCTVCDSTNINTIIEFVPKWQVVKTPTVVSNNPVLGDTIGKKIAWVDNISSHNIQRQINRIKSDEIKFKTKI